MSGDRGVISYGGGAKQGVVREIREVHVLPKVRIPRFPRLHAWLLRLWFLPEEP